MESLNLIKLAVLVLMEVATPEQEQDFYARLRQRD